MGTGRTTHVTFGAGGWYHLHRGASSDFSLGVALVAPSERYVAFMVEGEDITTVPDLSDDIWREIENWAADGNSRLPAKPAPLGPSIVAAVLGGAEQSVDGHRFAAIPIEVSSHDDLARLAGSLLPDVLKLHRSRET